MRASRVAIDSSGDNSRPPDIERQYHLQGKLNAGQSSFDVRASQCVHSTSFPSQPSNKDHYCQVQQIGARVPHGRALAMLNCHRPSLPPSSTPTSTPIPHTSPNSAGDCGSLSLILLSCSWIPSDIGLALSTLVTISTQRTALVSGESREARLHFQSSRITRAFARSQSLSVPSNLPENRTYAQTTTFNGRSSRRPDTLPDLSRLR